MISAIHVPTDVFDTSKTAGTSARFSAQPEARPAGRVQKRNEAELSDTATWAGVNSKLCLAEAVGARSQSRLDEAKHSARALPAAHPVRRAIEGYEEVPTRARATAVYETPLGPSETKHALQAGALASRQANEADVIPRLERTR